MTLTTHTRVTVQLDEDLDGIATGAADALTDMALALLLHGFEHHGSGATMQLVRTDGRLDLWLHDPECSPACLCRSAQLPSTAGPDHTHPAHVRLAMVPATRGAPAPPRRAVPLAPPPPRRQPAPAPPPPPLPSQTVCRSIFAQSQRHSRHSDVKGTQSNN